MDPLEKRLQRVRRRLLAVRAAETGLAGALVGAGAALAQTLLRIFWPHALPAGWAEPVWAIVWPAAGFGAAFLARLLVGVTLRQTAMATDRAGRLKERLATALEVLEAAGRAPGHELDAQLLEQARAAADRLDVPNLALARSIGRRGTMVLVAILILAGLALVPSTAGPPLAAPAASRAAEALAKAACDERIAPDLRQVVERSVARLLEAGARRRDADQATLEVRQAAAQVAERRDAAREALRKIESPEIRKMVEAAGAGDGAGAGAAAGELAGRLRGEPGTGGLPAVERERLADALEGAAPAAERANSARLAEELRSAADAIRRSEGDAAAALGRLAGAMTEALGDPSVEGAAVVLATVGQARRVMGLAEAPAPAEGAAVADAARPSEVPAIGEPAVSAEGGTSAAAGLPVSPEVRPEDRDVVRRYFGG
jgi:hypothetical protein